MKSDELKLWRMHQIAIALLYKYFGNISITKSVTPICDYVVLHQDRGLRFGVNVKSSSYIYNKGYLDSIYSLLNQDYSACCQQIPILLFCINESTETATMGFQISWEHRFPTIYSRPTLRKISKKIADKYLDDIEIMDDTIKVLPYSKIGILKEIIIEKDIAKNKFRGNILYIRRLTSSYNMKQFVRDKKSLIGEQFYPDETIYPNDILDDIIENAIMDNYKVVNKHNSHFILTPDARNVQRYSQDKRKIAYLTILPNHNEAPFLENNKIPIIDIEIYSKMNIEDVSFTYNMPEGDYLKKAYNIVDLINQTYVKISDYFL